MRPTVAAGRTQTREGARYRRLSGHRRKAKAQAALGNTQFVYHALLSHPGVHYHDLGVDFYDRRSNHRQVRDHLRRGGPGYTVTLTTAA